MIRHVPTTSGTTTNHIVLPYEMHPAITLGIPNNFIIIVPMINKEKKRREKTTQTMSAWVKEVWMPQNL
jgi:hypothetical protein